jgi:hypothetical protein
VLEVSAGNTSPTAEDYLAREARARMAIDQMLALAGWVVQDADAVNLSAARGIAVREFVLAPGHGRADCGLFVDRKPLGVLEAKAEGTILSNVEPQRDDYAEGMPDDLEVPIEPLPFTYMSTGTETRFKNGLDPEARTRNVFAVHRPETLAEWAAAYFDDYKAPTLRRRLQLLPVLDSTGLWPAQVEAISNLEVSLAEGRPRAFIVADGLDERRIAREIRAAGVSCPHVVSLEETMTLFAAGEDRSALVFNYVRATISRAASRPMVGSARTICSDSPLACSPDSTFCAGHGSSTAM